MTRTLRIAMLLAALFAAPAAASASPETGGTAAPTPAGQPPAAAPGQVALNTRPGHLLGRTVRIVGRAGGAPAGRTVALERRDPATGAWEPLGSAVTGEGGVFRASWRADRVGAVLLRGRLESGAGARAADADPELAITVFRPGIASWYGPGFYGNRTACGQKMTKRLRGVAHKTLPCGTKVSLFHKGRTVTVPVVDRGPFVKGRTWDLTIATARALGVSATVRVGALPR
jgi:rare lipoprotein A